MHVEGSFYWAWTVGVSKEGAEPFDPSRRAEDGERWAADVGIKERVVRNGEVAEVVGVGVADPYPVQVFKAAVLEQGGKRASPCVDP